MGTLKTWDEVVQKPEYQKLSDGDKAAAASRYFDLAYAPQMDANQVATNKYQFMQQAAAQNEAQREGAVSGGLRDIAASMLSIGPTALKGAAELGDMATAGKFDFGVAKAMEEGIPAIQEAVGSRKLNMQRKELQQVMADPNADAATVVAHALDKPWLLLNEAIPMLGSMALPVGAAGKVGTMMKAAGKAAPAVAKAQVGTVYGTMAAQAGATAFADPKLKDLPLEDRYKAASAASAVSLLTSLATGGGPTSTVAKRMLGEYQAGKVPISKVVDYLKEATKGGIMAASMPVGTAAGELAAGVTPDMGATTKEAALSGIIGAGMGMGAHALPKAPAPLQGGTTRETFDSAVEKLRSGELQPTMSSFTKGLGIKNADAYQLMQNLEARGVVSPAEAGAKRTVIGGVTPEAKAASTAAPKTPVAEGWEYTPEQEKLIAAKIDEIRGSTGVDLRTARTAAINALGIKPVQGEKPATAPEAPKAPEAEAMAQEAVVPEVPVEEPSQARMLPDGRNPEDVYVEGVSKLRSGEIPASKTGLQRGLGLDADTAGFFLDRLKSEGILTSQGVGKPYAVRPESREEAAARVAKGHADEAATRHDEAADKLRSGELQPTITSLQKGLGLSAPVAKHLMGQLEKSGTVSPVVRTPRGSSREVLPAPEGVERAQEAPTTQAAPEVAGKPERAGLGASAETPVSAAQPAPAEGVAGVERSGVVRAGEAAGEVAGAEGAKPAALETPAAPAAEPSSPAQIYADAVEGLRNGTIDPTMSSLRNNLGIPPDMARHLIQALEQRGVIGPAKEGQRRAVLPKPEGEVSPEPATSKAPKAAVDSEGRTLSPDERSWFGNSKVVGENNKPLVVYHATGAKFSEFDPNAKRQSGAYHGAGFYFADKAHAQAYLPEEGSRMVRAYLKIEKPFYGDLTAKDIETLKKWPKFAELYNADKAKYDAARNSMKDGEELPEYKPWLETLGVLSGDRANFIREALTRAGYDGRIVTFNRKTPFSDGETEYVAFRPDQIKILPEPEAPAVPVGEKAVPAPAGRQPVSSVAPQGEAAAKTRAAQKAEEAKAEKEAQKASEDAKTLDDRVQYAERTYEQSRTAEEARKAADTLLRLRKASEWIPVLKEFLKDAPYHLREAFAYSAPMETVLDATKGHAELGGLREGHKMVQSLLARRTQMLAAGSKTAKELRELTKGVEDNFNKVILMSTIAGVDARTNTKSAKINELYASLGENGRKAYGKYFDYYENMIGSLRHILTDNIESLGKSFADKDKLLNRLNTMLSSDNLITPYAPLSRDQNGQYWIAIGEKGSKDRQFITVNSKRARDKMIQDLSKKYNLTPEEMDYGDNLQKLRESMEQAPDSLLKELFKMIDESGASKDPEAALSREGLKDSIFQLWVHLQPEQSAYKQFSKRSKVPPSGYLTDTITNLEDSVRKFSFQFPRMQFGPQIKQALNQARAAVERQSDLTPYVNGVADRIANTHLAPADQTKFASFVNVINSFSFPYYMSSSTGLLAPVAAYQFGTAQLLKNHSLSDVARVVSDVGNVFKSMGVHDAKGNWIMPSVENSAAVRANPKDSATVATRKSEERTLLALMHDRNVTEGTFAREIYNDSNTVPLVEVPEIVRKAGKANDFLIGGLIHNGERISRELVYYASARLWRDKMLSGFRKTDAYKKADNKLQAEHDFIMSRADDIADKAAYDVRTSLFNYDAASRPIFMQNSFGKLAGQYTTFNLNAANFFIRNFMGMVKPMDGETRLGCLKAFTASMLTSWTLAGTVGMFGAGAVIGAIKALWNMYNEDKPKELRDLDANAWYRYEWLPSLLGDAKIGGVPVSEVVATGPINALTGKNISSRTNVNDIAHFPETRDVSSISTDAGAWAVWAAGAGPAATLQWFKGWQTLARGDVQKGLEDIYPWSTWRNISKATRYATQGETDKYGNVVVPKEAFSTSDILAQTAGFAPTVLSDTKALASKYTKIDQQVADTSKLLKERLALAYSRGDAEAIQEVLVAIDQFNADYGENFPKAVITDKAVEKAETKMGERKLSNIAGVPLVEGKEYLTNALLQPAAERIQRGIKENR